MKKHLLALCLIILSLGSEASHLLGGNLSYQCLGNGLFRFNLTVYRDCSGAAWNQEVLMLRGAASASLSLVSAMDISERCSASTTFTCNPPKTATGAAGTVSRFVYSGTVNLNALAPAPVHTGHVFYVSFPCCRPSLANTNGIDIAISTTMFRYTEPATGRALSPAELCDNSPVFVTDPITTVIQNPFDTVIFQHLAQDEDGDLVTHSVGFPLSDHLTPYMYTPPYSQSAPLPGIVTNRWVGASNLPVHPESGEMIICPSTTGNFVHVIAASGYRNGQLISRVNRDFTLRIINQPPGQDNPYNPTAATTLFTQRAPQISLPKTMEIGGRSSETWNFYANDSISLLLSATDLFPSLTGNPNDPSTWQQSPQTVKFSIQGEPLSNVNLSSQGCQQIPCATIQQLSANLPAPQPILLQYGNNLSMGTGYAAPQEVFVKFDWKPTCGQLSTQSQSQNALVRTYSLLMRAADNNCTLEGRTERAFVIRLMSLPLIPAPNFTTLNFDTASRQYTLNWVSAFDTTSIDTNDQANWGHLLSSIDLLAKSVGRRYASFRSYRVMRNVNQTNWEIAGELTNPVVSTFVDTMQFAPSHTVEYRIISISGCNQIELESQRRSNTIIASSVFDESMARVELYPNPGTGKYTLKVPSSQKMPNELQLFNVQGKKIRQWTTADGSQFAIEINDLPAGVYFLQSTEGKLRLKLVHQP